MGSTYYISKKRVPLVFGHVCSKCGNPVIDAGNIEVCASVQEKIFADNEARAEAAANEMLQLHLEQIRRCKETGYCLGKQNNENRYVREYLYYTGLVDPCPYCRTLEHWQDETGVTASSAEAYPLLFDTFDEATVWANELVASKAAEIENERENVDILALQKETEFLREFLLIERIKRENSALFVKKESLRQEIDKIDDALRKAGAFDIKKKADLHKQKKETQKELNALTPQIKIADEEYEARTRKSLERADAIEPLAYGTIDEMNIIKSGYSACFLVKANIPSQVANQREAQVDYYTNNPAATYMFGVQTKNPLPTPKVCSVCGAELPEEALFCQNCGTKV